MLEHKHVRTTEDVTDLGWAVLQHPLYGHDLTSSKYHLFGSLTENLQGRHYANGKALQNAVPMSSGMRPTVESKAGPLQTQKGPEGSRKLRFPDYMTAAQDGGKVSLTHRPPLPPGNTLGTHFC